MLWSILGVACVIYATTELSLAHARRPGSPRFGPVDASSGRPLVATLDRRTHHDERLARLRRRRSDR